MRTQPLQLLVEDRRFAFLVAHVDVLEPVEVVPPHVFDVTFQKRREPPVVGNQVDIVAIADVLADFLLAARRRDPRSVRN